MAKMYKHDEKKTCIKYGNYELKCKYKLVYLREEANKFLLY